ncbi:MAG: TetR/AcrR family transcriptional regulator [Actinomycetota bacterium]
MATRLPAAERRAGLVDAALTVFSAEGFQATTMDAVAAEAGVTKPVLYQHFPSKRDLFRGLLHDVSGRLRDDVTEAVSNATGPHDMVRRGMRAMFSFVAAHPDEYRLMFGEGVRSDEEFAVEVRLFERSMADAIADLIDIDGLERAGRLVLAHGIVGLAESTARHWVLGGSGLDLDEVVEHVAELAWHGLRAPQRVADEPRV